jgi:hypothetical protein
LAIKPVIETFPMAEADRALDHTRQGKARFRAVLVAQVARRAEPIQPGVSTHPLIHNFVLDKSAKICCPVP